MKLVVGLGNPGKEYQDTRHNVGYLVLDAFLGDISWKKKFNAMYYTDTISGEKVLFVKPLTYMNLSGNAVVEFVNYYDIELDDLLVIHDDLDLPFGKYKIKVNSSAGGHNGIKSIISSLGSQNFARLKVGISHDRSIDTKDYVLGSFSSKDKETFDIMQTTFNKIIKCFIKDGVDRTMNIYNTKEK